MGGDYVVIHEGTAVTPTESLDHSEGIVGKLAAGAVVQVTQVLDVARSQRIRGRLMHPPGWISLLDIESGRRWAVKAKS